MCKKVYVIIPVYNAERYLENGVHSVLSKTGLDFEIVLVNDGSTDRSGRICQELAENFAQVSVLHQENGGVSAARNTGIEFVLSRAADEDYIAFLDADDFWVSSFVPDPPETMDSDLIAYSSAGCNEGGSRFRILHRFQDETLFLGGANTRWINHGTFASYFYRVGMVRSCHLRFLPGIRNNEDVIFWRQASYCTQCVRFSSRILYAYRSNPASATHSVPYDSMHIPSAWLSAAGWAELVPGFSSAEQLRWRLECERTCGARLLEAARIMASRGCSAAQIQATLLDGPMGRHLQSLRLEDLAQWQQEDLLLIREDISKLIKRHRGNGIWLAMAHSLLRVSPVRLFWEAYRFPLRSVE